MKKQKGAATAVTTPTSKISISKTISKVRALFLTHRKFTAKELNEEAGFNDARKTISSLRAQGWPIKDFRLADGRKVYWLEADKRQFSLFNEPPK